MSPSATDQPADPGPTEWQAGPAVGVGPWPTADLPDDSRYDPELLADGDTRNVVDAYRYWRREAIVADIDERRHPFHVAIENFAHDANIGTVVRTANAFAAAAVHIVGRRRWNRRGAMVTDRYQHLQHHDTVADLIAWAREEGWPSSPSTTPRGAAHRAGGAAARVRPALWPGGTGVSDDAQSGADLTVSIAQFGSTRSINAGVAAGIAMHTWIVQHADLDDAW